MMDRKFEFAMNCLDESSILSRKVYSLDGECTDLEEKEIHEFTKNLLEHVTKQHLSGIACEEKEVFQHLEALLSETGNEISNYKLVVTDLSEQCDFDADGWHFCIQKVNFPSSERRMKFRFDQEEIVFLSCSADVLKDMLSEILSQKDRMLKVLADMKVRWAEKAAQKNAFRDRICTLAEQYLCGSFRFQLYAYMHHSEITVFLDEMTELNLTIRLDEKDVTLLEGHLRLLNELHEKV